MAKPGFRFGTEQRDAHWMDMAAGAAYLSMPSASAFRKWARRNGIPIFRLGGRLLRVSRRDLDAWIEARRCA